MGSDTSTSSDFTTETLMPRVYDELRKLASRKMSRENPGQTITGTALLHEAYLRLSKEGDEPRWANEKQFFSAAAEAMRRILIDRVRGKLSLKRGSEYEHTELDEAQIQAPASDGMLISIDEALDVFASHDPDGAELVKLRFFAGLTLEEIAESTGVAIRTVSRRWRYARAWLEKYLSERS